MGTADALWYPGASLCMQVTALMNMPTESRQMRVCKTPVRDMMLTSAPQSTMSGAGVLAESKQGKLGFPTQPELSFSPKKLVLE